MCRKLINRREGRPERARHADGLVTATPRLGGLTLSGADSDTGRPELSITERVSRPPGAGARDKQTSGRAERRRVGQPPATNLVARPRLRAE